MAMVVAKVNVSLRVEYSCSAYTVDAESILLVITVCSGHVEFVPLPRTLTARPESAIATANMMLPRSAVVCLCGI